MDEWRDSLTLGAPWFLHRITHRSDVGAARRQALSNIAADSRQDLRAPVSLCVTELGTNLLRHAKNGRLFQGPGLLPGSWHVFSIDDGPGFDAVHVALQDGWSSRGSMGTGLGAVKRLSRVFDVRGSGRTVIYAGLGSADGKSLVAAIPHRRELRSGDAWVFTRSRRGVRVALFDGAGKGPLARSAAVAACQVVRNTPHEVPLETTIAEVHAALGDLARPVVGSVVDIRRSVVRAVTVGAGSPVLAGPAGLRTFEVVDGLVGRSVKPTAASTRNRRPGDRLVLRTDGAGDLAFGEHASAFQMVGDALQTFDGRDDFTYVVLDLDSIHGAR